MRERQESNGNGWVKVHSLVSGSRFVFGAFWLLVFTATFLVSGPWAGFHGVLLGGVGLLMLLRPPVVCVPRLWWILAALFVTAGAGAFLPAGWFAIPEWRRQLGALGVETGPLVAIQARQAAEAFALFAIMLFTGLWLAGHRPSPSQLRVWALAFTLGVACYAIFSKITQNTAHASHEAGEGHFGFFPNRNHTATYLAMGALCGLGNVLQAIRDRRFVIMAVALAGAAVCLWAVVGWSASRGGLVLVAIGFLVWLPILGRRYLGKHGLRALGLIGLTAIGIFLIADSEVKNRISEIVDKAGATIRATGKPSPEGAKPAVNQTRNLDYRIPTALDTMDLIRDFKWTGIGAGQFYYVFPQYRKLAAFRNDTVNIHPESDWLWMAAEAGIPATLALAALVILAFRKSLVSILGSRDRALRSACLVAAMLVPIHGIFDVPGHRITLAWSAAFLFALSLRAPTQDETPARASVWPYRIAALILIVIAGFLVNAEWWGGPQPAQTAASAALEQAHSLYREDEILQQAARAKGQTYQPDRSEDRLVKALAILDQTTPLAPLNRDILRYRCFLAFQFDDKYPLIDRNFAIDRALDPTWVGCPLIQAEAWAKLDPQKTAVLWAEALRRAAKLDQIQPGSLSSRANTLQKIREFAKGKPDLEKLPILAE